MLYVTLSCLGIIFSIWMYMLIFCENPPKINISKLQQWWLSHRHHPVRSIIDYIFSKISDMFRWGFHILKKLGHFLKELFAEIIVHLILRSILNLIKAIFHVLARIFD